VLSILIVDPFRLLVSLWQGITLLFLVHLFGHYDLTDGVSNIAGSVLDHRATVGIADYRTSVVPYIPPRDAPSHAFTYEPDLLYLLLKTKRAFR
jgi:hypothetical protein